MRLVGERAVAVAAGAAADETVAPDEAAAVADEAVTADETAAVAAAAAADGATDNQYCPYLSIDLNVTTALPTG